VLTDQGPTSCLRFWEKEAWVSVLMLPIAEWDAEAESQGLPPLPIEVGVLLKVPRP
jgi:hypothetical protein